MKSRVALVTGASAGIGAAIARSLARRGWNLVLAARRMDLLHELAQELSASVEGPRFLPLRMDVADLDSISSGVAAVQGEFSHLDVLVNNSGVGSLDWHENHDPVADIAASVQVNLLGAMQLTRAVLPGMLERGTGHIINIASVASWVGLPMYSVYAATKFGLRGYSEALRREVEPRGVRVSVVYPGPVRTGFAAGSAASRRKRLRTPGFLTLDPEAVGEAVARLAERPRRSLVIPGVMRPLIWLNVLLPGLVDWAVGTAYIRREKRAGS